MSAASDHTPARSNAGRLNDSLVLSLIDAQACNAAQDRALFNASPEIDSALEYALVLLKTANDSQRPYAVALVRSLREIRVANAQEREFERTAAAIADPISNVHEFAKLARPLLADIGNPIMPPRRLAERLGELHALFVRTSPRTRAAFSLRPILGVSKYTTLVERLAEWGELQTTECAA